MSRHGADQGGWMCDGDGSIASSCPGTRTRCFGMAGGCVAGAGRKSGERAQSPCGHLGASSEARPRRSGTFAAEQSSTSPLPD
jgi:hypothetical protein